MNQAVAERAERERHEQAEFWFGAPFPKWAKPAEIKIARTRLPANAVPDQSTGGGHTSFAHHSGEVYGWHGEWYATTKEHLLESVVPHEVSHTVWHTRWRVYGPDRVPRWLDEGLATMMEHEPEQQKRLLLAQRQTHAVATLLDWADRRYTGKSYEYSVGYAVCLKTYQDLGKDRFCNWADRVVSGGTQQALLSIGYRSTRDFQARFRLPILGGLIGRRCRCNDQAATVLPANWIPGPAPGPAPSASILPDHSADFDRLENLIGGVKQSLGDGKIGLTEALGLLAGIRRLLPWVLGVAGTGGVGAVLTGILLPLLLRKGRLLGILGGAKTRIEHRYSTPTPTPAPSPPETAAPGTKYVQTAPDDWLADLTEESRKIADEGFSSMTVEANRLLIARMKQRYGVPVNS